MKIVIAEDQEGRASALKGLMLHHGHTVDVFPTKEVAYEVQMSDCSVVIYSTDEPQFDAIREMRMAKRRAAIIVLCGSNRISDKVAALAAGADDYLGRPFHHEELMARIMACGRRCAGHTQSIITVGRLSVSLTDHHAFWDGVKFHLTGKQYQVLEVLMLKRGATVTKEGFISHLYQQRDEPEPKIVDVFICKLRDTLNGCAKNGGRYVETVWGRGYRISANAESMRTDDARRSMKYVRADVIPGAAMHGAS